MPKYIKLFFTNLLILCLLLLLLEIVLRAKGDNYTWAEKGQSVYNDPWAVKYQGKLQVRQPGEHEEVYPEFVYTVAANKDGVRDYEHDVAKADTVKRILGLGDSFMEGMGTVFDSTILSQMSNIINREHISSKFEMLSGGVSGSDLFRSYNLLNERLIKYRPDYLIILFNNTDFNDWIIKGDEKGARPNINKPSRLKRLFFRYSHLYRSISINIFKNSWLQQSPSEQKKSWHYFKKDFEEVLIKYTQLIGGADKILFVFHPLINEYEHQSYYYPFDELMAIVNKHTIRVADVMECLKQSNAKATEIYWKMDMHFNSKGYGLVADCIAEQNFINP